MKNIKPITTWVNGQNVTAKILNLQVVGGQLHNSATFYYQLLDKDSKQVADGNLVLSDADYQIWDNDDYPYDWAAKQLNLTIIENE